MREERRWRKRSRRGREVGTGISLGGVRRGVDDRE